MNFEELQTTLGEGDYTDEQIMTMMQQMQEIEDAFSGYCGSQGLEDGKFKVSAGTTAMDIIQDIFIYATDNEIFTMGDTTMGEGVTYISEIDGLSPESIGALAGWMYTVGDYSADCSVASVGAADYVMTEGTTITWFFTTDFYNHPFE